MELSDLSVFVAVVEEGGITRAAEKLHRVPSNVTARVRKLEQELGKDLFLREKNRLRISPAGEHLLTYARDILALAREAVDGFSHQQPRGRLRLGSIEMAAATRLVEPLMVYHRTYPEVDIEVSTSPTGTLLQQVLAGELDMALVSDPTRDSRLVVKPMYEEELVLVSDTAHRAIRSPADLAEAPTLLGFSNQCVYRQRLASWFSDEDSGASQVAKVVEINSYHALLSCVTAGMGVGIAPRGVIEIYPYKEGLKIHRLPAKWRRSASCLVWRKDSEKPSMMAFAECMAQA